MRLKTKQIINFFNCKNDKIMRLNNEWITNENYQEDITVDLQPVSITRGKK